MTENLTLIFGGGAAFIGFLLLGCAVTFFMFFRLRQVKQQRVQTEEGIHTLKTLFTLRKVSNETQPIIVVALEKSGMNYTTWFLGVTNHRWLAINNTGTEVERIREDGPFMDVYYEETHYQGNLQPEAVFGRSWLFYEQAEGYPEQRKQLKELFDFVGLTWMSD